MSRPNLTVFSLCYIVPPDTTDPDALYEVPTTAILLLGIWISRCGRVHYLLKYNSGLIEQIDVQSCNGKLMSDYFKFVPLINVPVDLGKCLSDIDKFVQNQEPGTSL
jgi:hypothetical protein